MKNLFLSITLLCVFAISFVACIQKPDHTEPEAIVTLSVQTLPFGITGGQNTFTVHSTKDWTITGGNATCVVSPESGVKDKTTSVVVTLPVNNDMSERTYELTIKSGTVTKTVAVSQLSYQYADKVSEISVMEFAILPAQNERIYSPVVFVTRNGANYDFNGTQEILYYKTDLTALKASWTSNATKVTIGATTQTSGVTVNSFVNEVTYRFYAKDNNYKEYKIKLTNPSESYSGLPVLVLTTDDGADIKNKVDWQMGRFKLDAQGNAGVSDLTGVTSIRGRGNSTWTMPKKPYALKLSVKNEGTFGGMNAHKRWAVLANYADKTLLRNRVTFEIAKRTRLAWTPDSRFVDLILNGRFQGNYLLTEQIRVDKNRVNIVESDDQVTGPESGYLMEVDRNYDEVIKFRPTRSELPVMIKNPEVCNAGQLNYIKDYIEQVEALLYKTVLDSTEYGKLIDIPSFIDSWIVYELSGNMESKLPGSIYMYKNAGGKIFSGPMWDFDRTSFKGNNEFVMIEYSDPRNIPNQWDIEMRRNLWFMQLFTDPKIKAKAKERWNALYPTFQNIPAFIDQQAAYLSKSAVINWTVWPRTTMGENHDEHLEWNDAVILMKENYNKRLTRLNAMINAWK